MLAYVLALPLTIAVTKSASIGCCVRCEWGSEEGSEEGGWVRCQGRGALSGLTRSFPAHRPFSRSAITHGPSPPPLPHACHVGKVLTRRATPI